MNARDDRPGEAFAPAAGSAGAAGATRSALWASAGALAAIAVFGLVSPSGGLRGGAGGGSPVGTASALADMVMKDGSFTMMTTASGNEETLWVIDERTEQVLVYGVGTAQSVELLDRQSLPVLFTQARARAGGTPRPER